MFTPIGFAGTSSVQSTQLPPSKPFINTPHLVKPLTNDLFFKGETETPEEQIPKLARQCQKKGLNLQTLLNNAQAMAAGQKRDWQSVYVEILKQKLAESNAGSTPKSEVIKKPKKLSNRANSRPVPTEAPRKASVKQVSSPPVALEASGDEMDIDSDSLSPETRIQKLEKKCKQHSINLKEIKSTAQAVVEAESANRRTRGINRQQTVYISLLNEALNETQRKAFVNKERIAQLQELDKLKAEAKRYYINIAEIEQKANDKNNRTYDRGNISHRDKYFIHYLKEALANLDQDAEGEDDIPYATSHTSPFKPQVTSEIRTFEHLPSMPLRLSQPDPEPAASGVSQAPLSFENYFKNVTGFDLREHGYI